MAHGSNIISSIKLPNGNTYEIHDAQAIHSAEELGLSAALVFKGVKASVSALPSAGNKVGDVWHVSDKELEYVWTSESKWEALGSLHDAASSTHIHNVTVAGSNAESTVTGTVAVPTISSTAKHLVASNAAPTVTPETNSVLGANTVFSVSGGEAETTNIKATASGAEVGANGVASAITGFGAHTKGSALGVNATFKVSGGTAKTNKMVTTTIKNPTAEAVSIPNVTGNTAVTASKVKNAGSKTAGTAATWSASVDNGVLSFDWIANTPTVVTLPTFDEVTATNTVLGENLAASKVSTSEVIVATGTVSSTGTGSAVATGVNAINVSVESQDAVSAITTLGTPTTSEVLTGVKVTKQPIVALSTGASAGTGVISVATGVSDISVSASGDNVSALTGVSVAAPKITLAEKDAAETGSVPVVSSVTSGSTSVSIQNGKAAAQKWTQGETTVSTPV